MAFISFLTIVLTVVQFGILIYLFITVRKMNKLITKHVADNNQLIGQLKKMQDSTYD
ncbi:hypothetical protein [Aquibacillus salsiterrae]|uniref:DUF4083 domain-containing protein n=1 Tax=Aquibacillus salsiterrae TaxID=2950439 RepID=A0A9X4AES9_9BACI|nr:hypothetical protein [Aquibacillus salsiterrae]MDC3417146.1 hypothetical protein [Aquibacillus salsiterrae]